MVSAAIQFVSAADSFQPEVDFAAIAVRRSRTKTSRYLVRSRHPEATTLADPTSGIQGTATTCRPASEKYLRA